MLPRHIDKKLREVIKDLPETFEVVKKKDHYFLYDGTVRVCCIGNNSSPSKQKQYLINKNIDTINKYMENRNADNNG